MRVNDIEKAVALRDALQVATNMAKSAAEVTRFNGRRFVLSVEEGDTHGDGHGKWTAPPRSSDLVLSFEDGALYLNNAIGGLKADLRKLGVDVA